MNNPVPIVESKDALHEKILFLSRPDTYGDTKNVEVVETHMSVVFLTDKLVYKLKKPVTFSFLDFSSLRARYVHCQEEVRINQALGGGTYLSVVPLNMADGKFQLGGEGEAVDWLVRMKRLPEGRMLHRAIQGGLVRQDLLQRAARKLVDFYLNSEPLFPDQEAFRRTILEDIEVNSTGLLNDRFTLNHSLVVSVAADLLHFVIKNSAIFDLRTRSGRIIDAHGDLRPEHICLTEEPVIIDRLEFNRNFRIMDVAEELAFLAMECEMLGSAQTGQLVYDLYQERCHDSVPEALFFFYKAKRAFLRARLSIHHLLEEKYAASPEKWQSRCERYLAIAAACCKKTEDYV